MVLVVFLVGAILLAVLPVWINPNIGVQNDPHITKLIYPTIGNPAIVIKGADLTLEFDPREQDFNDPFQEVSGFNVSVKTSNGVALIRDNLPVKSATVGYTTQWPEYVRTSGQDRRIYRVTVTVPRDLPHDLYDVTVQAKAGDAPLSDTQPHALEAIDAYKDDFTFVQLTDIHVWGQEIEYPSCTYKERSERPNGSDPKRKGAIYYQKAIDQINITRPDFVVMSGDFMFGQRYFVQDNGAPWGETTEYQYEMNWFLQETMRLDVPVFMTMGNHDSYNEGAGGAHEDWFNNWRKFYGPVHHSFDYGEYHFVSANSQDWKPNQRLLVDWEGVLLQPRKYKGNLTAGGDKAEKGITYERLAALDDTKYTGELAWIRDDLKAHQSSKMRIMVMHHDPYKADGSGEMWGEAAGDSLIAKLKFGLSKVLGMGDGAGRLAMLKLMQDYRVALEISGHDHSDYVATKASAIASLGNDFVDVFTWKGGGGDVRYVNTTSTQFQSASESDKYPGYRRIRIAGGKVLSYDYKEPKWSYPSYAETNVGGITNLADLKNPAITQKVTNGPVAAPGAIIETANALDVPVPSFGEVALPLLTGGYFYTITGGSFGELYPVGQNQNKQVYQVLSEAPAKGAVTVRVQKSSGPDTSRPEGIVAINGGAPSTASPSVSLDFAASDTGGAGISLMMISNSPDFKGAAWEPYRTTATWELPGGAAGPRTVHVKFRDAAMPGNESKTVKATIEYAPVR